MTSGKPCKSGIEVDVAAAARNSAYLASLNILVEAVESEEYVL